MSLISLLFNLFYCIKNSLKSGHFFQSCRLWWSFNSRKSQLVNRLEFYVPNDWGDFKQNGILPRDSHFTIERPSKNKRENVFVYGVNSDNQRFSLEIIWNPVHDNNNGHISAKFFFQDGENCYSYTAAERIYNGEHEIYKVGDLSLEIKLPFSLLILRFKGICKVIKENVAHGYKFMDFTMLIKPPYEVFDHGLIHEPSFLTSQLCQQSVFDDNPSLPDTYDVGVQIRSNIRIDHGPEREIHLFGHRGKLYQEIYDELSDSIEVTRFFGYSPKKGYHFSLSNTQDEKRGTEIINGCASWGINWAYPVQQTTFHRSLMAFDEFEFMMKTQYREYVINVAEREIKNSRFRPISIDKSPGWSYTLMHPFKLPNSNEFLQFDYFDRILPKVERLVLSIDDHDCLNSALTGGKGSSLAKLNLMKDVIIEKDGEKCCFSVPKALVITKIAQKHFLDGANSYDKINTLQKEVKRDETERICNDLIKHIEAQELTDHLKNVIRIKMNEYFGPSWDAKKFAVRSSAVGEDSETMSCAGQMETFLGVQGEEDVFKSIVKCWASQYRFIAVQYKRNNGLPVANDMAVVIQELIECDKAGVLFTCDPVTGDLSETLITANYGLGESVVSSLSEPDTIRVKLGIDQQGNLSISGISEIVIGSKEKIVSTGGDQPGSQILENERRENCCIDENEILKLTEVCLKICRFYRGSCDIEWGIKSTSGDESKFQVYIFQCRPVTSTSAPSDWQLIHELDSAHPCETECLTRANVGEVYPGASSHICLTLQLPLGSFGFIKRFLFSIKNFRLTPYNGRGIMVCRNNVFFCIKDGALMRYDQEPGKESLTTLGMEYSLLGRRMDDLEVKLDSYERLTTGPRIPAWKGLINLFQMIAPVYWRVKRFENKPLNIDLNDTQKNGTSHKLFVTLLRNFEHQWKAFDLHLCSTFASSFMNLFLIGLLSTKDDRHLFTDFSLLLSSCEKFVSARIPESLRELAELILPFKEKFLSLSDEQALQYLNDSKNPVYLKFKKFMEENGHRGLKEYDYSGKVWRKNPAAILQSLRILLQTDCASHGTSSKNNDDQIISQLKTPLTKNSKFLLKRIALPLARTFVGTREESKNKCVWSIDQQRKVFDRIAQMCVSENLLPDASLLYYMTSFEIYQLTSQQKSNSQLVSLAKRRQKLLSTIDEYEYPSLVYGPAVEPSSRGTEDSSNIQIESSDVIKGTVVSRGKTKGKVYVARKIEDIDGLQAGDVLVTYSTDVGWSPFFPIIGGLITEIGGLISHGAVVAREFGLPCVVGVRGATQVLKTGETITLDADNGIIMKISDD